MNECLSNSLLGPGHLFHPEISGIPAALVSVGAMNTLIELLYSPAELVRSSAATAVGYMTFNRGAMRILLTACRR